VRPAVAIVVLLVAASPALGGGMDETRRALVELKALCDAGLVAPAVCLEKQRAIVGLGAREAAGAAGTPLGPGTIHRSALGFRVVLPPGWAPLAPAEVTAGVEALRSRTEGNPDVTRLVERLRVLETRGAELFVNGRDVLHVQRSTRPPPVDAAAAASLCERQETVASRAAARRLQTYACGSRVVAGAPAFHLERDGLVPETRMVQYWLPAGNGASFRVVMTARASDADARRRELDAIVESLREDLSFATSFRARIESPSLAMRRKPPAQTRE
jgi:hypothetical protein